MAAMASLHETLDFSGPSAFTRRMQEDTFIHCSFDGLQLEGIGLESVVVGSSFKNCSWYWGIFNTAVLVDVTFVDCTFRGTHFGGATFTRCRFERCRFIEDNLNVGCKFNECFWYDCEQVDCVGLPTAYAQRRHPQRAKS